MTSAVPNTAYRASDRLALVLHHLDIEVPDEHRHQVAAFCDHVGSQTCTLRDVWFALAVLRARLPTTELVLATRRRLRSDGPQAAFGRWLRPDLALRSAGRRQVEVVVDQVLVDVLHTARTSLATGIQRVARQTARRWAADHTVTLVGWTNDRSALRRLDPHERATALEGVKPPERTSRERRVLVPWGGTYLLPELAVEPPRTAAVEAMARFAGLRTGVIGFDCVPITSAETTGPGMSAAFAGSLAAVRHMDQVATISVAAGHEYGGWRQMLAGTGLPGPEVTPVLLPVEAEPARDQTVARMAADLRTDRRPLLLCVGSHEPRKNHLAVLHAAEAAWRDGHEFTLLFVGGASWASQAFHDRLDDLQSRGRPVRAVTAMPDDELWAAYRLARCVLFPSLNEGFGLPVAEALACGTPVITSNFGSMAEIAHDGGALLVDPRDDDALTRALTAVVTDDDLHAELATAARARPPGRTWDDYARDVWDLLAGSR